MVVASLPQQGDVAVVQEDGVYYSRDQVALYILTYGKLPSNFITKVQAQALGWTGGLLDSYAPGKSIGGDYFGNYEQRLPPGSYRECDIDTYKRPRGSKRIVFTPQRDIYYTEDHYVSFVKLLGVVDSDDTGKRIQWSSATPDDKPDSLQETSLYGGMGASYKGGTFNGYAWEGEQTLTGTFSLAVKKPAKGKTTTSATLTFVSLASGKKMKLVGNVNLATGEGTGALVGLKVGTAAVGGTVAKVGTLEGGLDAAKVKDSAALSVLGKFSGKSYVIALVPEQAGGYAQGGYSTLSLAMAAKGKVKVSGVLADGTKVTASAQMTVGDEYCYIPVVYAKKSRFGFVARFDKNTYELVDVTSLTPWKNTVKPAFTIAWTIAARGVKGNLRSGENTMTLDEEKLLGLVPGAIAQTPFEIPLTVKGNTWNVGKAAKVAYKGGNVTIAGENVSGLKLAYTAKTGMFKGSFTVYAVKGGKLVKKKFTVNGAVVNGAAYGSAVLKGKGSIAVTIE